MQRGNDRTESDQASDDLHLDCGPSKAENENSELARAQHDLAVANDAGERPDDLPGRTTERD